jgi:ubiquinone/menaquinone biosynthesis C-methylase UbiE
MKIEINSERSEVKKSIDPYASLRSIMEQHGAVCTPNEFHWLVNEAYHNAESLVYDEIHHDMVEGLLPIWERLLSHIPSSSHKLNILDIGAGTGIVGEFINTIIPNRIAEMTVLDPSHAMIEQCRKKATHWAFPCTFIHGNISKILESKRYNLITINSVLHHIVELESFCRHIQNYLYDEGLLLIAHDPRAEAEFDEILKKRIVLAKKKFIRKLKSKGLFVKAVNKTVEFSCKIAEEEYIEPLAKATCKPLLKSGVITKPMKLNIIHSITDYHVPGINRFGAGINIDYLKQWMEKLHLIDYFTYMFQGCEWTRLFKKEKELEIKLWNENDQHGALIGSAWRLKPSKEHTGNH